jgi:hypothetical protein
MKRWKVGRLEGWKVGELEGWKVGELEDWKYRKKYRRKDRKLENWGLESLCWPVMFINT